MEGARGGLLQLGLASMYSGSHSSKQELMEVDLQCEEGQKLTI